MSIDQIFEKFNSLRVLVVGDVMLDAYVWGKVDRISPEAPVPVVHVQKREYRLGGAGNVLLNVQSLGAEAIVCSVIGTDGPGDILESELRARGLNCEGLVRSGSRTTTIKERIIAGAQQVVRIDTETDHPVSAEESERLVAKVKSLIPTCQVVIFEDYDKGVLTAGTIAEITSLANAMGIPTVVDPKRRNFLSYRGVTLFKPNLKELREGLAVSVKPDSTDDIRAAIGRLKETMRIKGALITLSEWGVYIDYEEESHRIAAHYRRIADVSGAGDTVISIAALCVALRLSPRYIAGISNLGGGLVCESVGVVPVDKQRLLEEAKKAGYV